MVSIVLYILSRSPVTYSEAGRSGRRSCRWRNRTAEFPLAESHLQDVDAPRCVGVPNISFLEFTWFPGYYYLIRSAVSVDGIQGDFYTDKKEKGTFLYETGQIPAYGDILIISGTMQHWITINQWEHHLGSVELVRWCGRTVYTKNSSSVREIINVPVIC